MCAQSCPSQWSLWALQAPVLGTFLARILEWVAIFSSRGIFLTQDQTRVPCVGRRIVFYWATWGSVFILYLGSNSLYSLHSSGLDGAFYGCNVLYDGASLPIFFPTLSAAQAHERQGELAHPKTPLASDCSVEQWGERCSIGKEHSTPRCRHWPVFRVDGTHRTVEGHRMVACTIPYDMCACV